MQLLNITKGQNSQACPSSPEHSSLLPHSLMLTFSLLSRYASSASTSLPVFWPICLGQSGPSQLSRIQRPRAGQGRRGMNQGWPWAAHSRAGLNVKSADLAGIGLVGASEQPSNQSSSPVQVRNILSKQPSELQIQLRSFQIKQEGSTMGDDE